MLFALHGGGSLLAAVVQVIFGALAVALASEIARASFGERAAWIAGVPLIFCGPVAFHEVAILQSALDPFLVALTLCLATRRDVADGRAGIAAALLALNRPNAILRLVALAAWLVWRHRVRAVPFIAAAALTIAPVTLRNWIVSHRFVLISSHSGRPVTLRCRRSRAHRPHRHWRPAAGSFRDRRPSQQARHSGAVHAREDVDFVEENRGEECQRADRSAPATRDPALERRRLAG